MSSSLTIPIALLRQYLLRIGGFPFSSCDARSLSGQCFFKGVGRSITISAVAVQRNSKECLEVKQLLGSNVEYAIKGVTISPGHYHNGRAEKQ